MPIYHLLINKQRFYVTLIALLPFAAIRGNMNCSAMSLPRAASTMIASNGHSLGLNGSSNSSYLNGNGMKACLNGNGHTYFSTKANGMNGMNGTAAATLTPTTTQSKKPELAAKIIQQSNIVCFDVDSTVIKEEGIDELANYCGKGSEVARVTKEAMGGGMTFQEALKIRLNIIRPTQQQITEFIRKHPSILTTNLKRFVDKLKNDRKQVYLISGGFDCLIEPVAKELGIPLCNVFANKLLFEFNGEYANFDETQPTSKSGGKAEAITIIKDRHQNDDKLNDAIVTMIGDGATDLEAVPPANYFIGFGGNVVRAEVYKRAQYYVTDFAELM